MNLRREVVKRTLLVTDDSIEFIQILRAITKYCIGRSCSECICYCENDKYCSLKNFICGISKTPSGWNETNIKTYCDNIDKFVKFMNRKIR